MKRVVCSVIKWLNKLERRRVMFNPSEMDESTIYKNVSILSVKYSE